VDLKIQMTRDLTEQFFICDKQLAALCTTKYQFHFFYHALVKKLQQNKNNIMISLLIQITTPCF